MGIFRKRRADELAEIDAEITAFGEELARHAFVPGDAALASDYERALDAYERAKSAFEGDRDRADAADVLRALADGRHALACVDARAQGRPLPPRPEEPSPARPGLARPPSRFSLLGGEHRARGRGEATVTLRCRFPEEPTVLTVRLDDPTRHQVDLVTGDRRTTLLRSEGGQQLAVPFPAGLHREFRLAIGTHGRWRAWLHSPGDLPVFDGRLDSRGSLVFRNAGGPERIVMRHQGRGAFSLTALTPGFEQGDRILSGMGSSAVAGELPAVTFVHVRAHGPWTLERR